MDIKRLNENINNHNVNFIIKLQTLIKQWNQDLKLPEISDLYESTLEISHKYSNMTYINDNTKIELCHLLFNDM
jgi:hypothetical protein